ncbi:uncharacterized protein J7T54_001607 [Emericellopsis cladophorae]|uniref:Uncharacterized protein n=1 Tax=Emericellopsis cladophorae TaxID=2686198 RepID=A0A9P9Y593_9HYPO|nr:uncharacterized protein J7T54_001607 [Emericellopsis cladophorae]KAI6783731.1 hypothetical protein J7T54_001607 [Emericellopsis cladophorae]
MEIVGPIEHHLFGGCCLEAHRCDAVALQLEGLRGYLLDASAGHLSIIIDDIRLTACSLRELADLSQVHQDRIPVVLNHLNILLPCLSRTLRDITSYYEDTTISKINRWRNMYHCMKDEGDGMTLGGRLMLYNYFLGSLRDVLLRSPNFDLNGLETARVKVMQLRENRNIPPPPAQVGPRMRSTIFAFENDPQIFSMPLPSRTALKNQIQWVNKHFTAVYQLTRDKIHCNSPFNDDKICLIAYENGHDLCPDGCVLRFKRWSSMSACSKLWAALSFQTWEELVLMYSSFLALKARNRKVVKVAPDEYLPKGERKLFQARISDDGFWHSLAVYKDITTGGIRLLASACEGPLKQCPIWTAFVTQQSASTTWIKRVSNSKHRIRLMDVQLYVFCQDYRQNRQRKGKSGAFEISFHQAEGCDRFIDLFPVLPKRAKTPQLAGP